MNKTNINEKIFEQFKKFTEKYLGLTGPAFNDYEPEVFNKENFQKIFKNNKDIQTFNNEKMFDIPEVIMFIETLCSDGFFLWEHPEPRKYIYYPEIRAFRFFKNNICISTMDAGETIDDMKKCYQEFKNTIPISS